MKVKITPTQDIEQLKENLRKRVHRVKIEEQVIIAETDNPEKLSKIPGIESFEADEEEKGLGGKPVQERVYARIESREDAVKALLATIQGYNLVVFKTEREWDLRQLRKYNPRIIQLDSDEPAEELEIKKSISEAEGTQKVDIEMPPEEEIETIYREMLT